jgi:hypothetical protein
VADEDSIRIWRVYADADGKSKLEAVDVPLATRESGHGALSKLYAGKGVIFRRTPANLNMDWHPAPRRQLIVNLSGEGELETSDGSVLILQPGMIELVEDTTGQGHRTRGRGSEDRTSLFLPLDDDTSLV